MSQVLTGEQLAPPRVLSRGIAAISTQPQRLALGAILVMSGVLETYRLSRIGYGNEYYAATVRSMLTSWHNFFFASYDPGGFVSVDKPPVGFWLQTLSAKVFGFSGVSLLLPEALATVASVALLYALVRRSWGVPAGLVAALALALTPITIVTGRNNTIDSILVLALLGAAWAMLRANETGKLRWLLASMALVGVGFNIKMLEAYLVLPALGALYLVGTRARRWRLIGHAALAVLVLLVVSLSWVTAVDLTPAGSRPYVGSSSTNSALELALGYNGLQRLLGRTGGGGGRTLSLPTVSINIPTGSLPGGGGGVGGSSENGAKGALRLINDQLGTQVSWLLPLALVGIVAGAWQTRFRRRLPLNRPQQSLVLWGVWFLTGAIFFSVAGFFHTYYLVTLAPAIAALAGIGVTALWRDYQRRRFRGWMLVGTLLATAALQVYLLRDITFWHHRLVAIIVGGSIAAVIVLALAKLLPRLVQPRRAAPALFVALTALLIAPTIWGGYTVQAATNGTLPVAGPVRRNASAGGFASIGGPRGGFGIATSQADVRLIQYLEAHRSTAHYLVAVESSMAASPIIIATGEPVMALGGFSGNDPILTIDKLAKLVSDGTVRYFLLQGGGRALDGGLFGSGTNGGRFGEGRSGEFRNATPPGNFDLGSDGGRPNERNEFGGTPPNNGIPANGGRSTEASITMWVEQHCQTVSESEYGTAAGALYDCSVSAGS